MNKYLKKARDYVTSTKKDFWPRLCIILFVGKWVLPFMVTYLVAFQVGLMVPGVDVNETYHNVSVELANNLLEPMEMMTETGQSVAEQNPTMAIYMSQAVGWFIWGTMAAMFFLILDIIAILCMPVIEKIIKWKNKR